MMFQLPLLALALSTGHWRRPWSIQRAGASFAERSSIHASATGVRLDRVCHLVTKAAPVASFYQTCFGLQATNGKDSTSTILAHPSSEGNLKIELEEGQDGGFDANCGYQGLSIRCNDVEELVTLARNNGGQVVQEPHVFDYGASLFPDQDENQKYPMKQAVVADPAGYPLFLYEAGEEKQPVVTTVRLDVFAWKASEDWWTSTLGWTRLRWQSNIPDEASITVTVGNADYLDKLVACGPTTGDAGGVVQLRYPYGTKPINSKSPQCLVFAGGESHETSPKEPDSYSLRFE